MNRNVESHFSQLPQADIQRSVFDRSSTHKTSLNVGDLVPFYIDEVLPGDSFKVTTSKVIRLQTLLTPVMDNMYLDTYFFFVPNRLAWQHWKEFCGENTESAWLPETEYQIPSISSPVGGFQTGTIADYFGLPVVVEWSNTAKHRPSALPFRSYALICQEFFRDENLTDPLNIPTGDANQTGSNGSNYIDDVANGGKPFKVAKYHDFFTSMLPAPQKGDPVTFDFNPVVNPIGPYSLDVVTGTADKKPATGTSFEPLHLLKPDGTLASGGTSSYYSHTLTLFNKQNRTDLNTFGVARDGNGDVSNDFPGLYPSNLKAQFPEISNIEVSGISFNINDLRLAFQLQKFYERNARGGTRYIEILKSHFGVTSPDARLQRPEYLGGNRVPVAIHEVTNNAQSEQDFLGDLGAMSVTSDVHFDFEKSFTEHGYVIGVCCLRYDHSYPQGLEPFWMRRRFTDFYLPVFASIGEQPYYQACICATAANMDSDDVFGYNEAWADYRYKPDRCSGEMRPGVSNTLASWNFADYYTDAPTLSDEWIREDKTNVDRTLAVTSVNANQAWMDIYIKNICTRPMPMYSIPGLIDHH